MKTKLKYICLSAAAGLTLSLSSCSDFMDLTPEDQYDEATVWSDADLAKTVVNDVYSYVCDIAQEVNPDAWTDDAFFTHVYGCRDINEATVSPSNLAPGKAAGRSRSAFQSFPGRRRGSGACVPRDGPFRCVGAIQS